MAKLGDRYVAAIAPQQQDERATGVPPHWNSYITVDDVDSVSARVEELGGALHAPPFDVMDVGRMSAHSDPTGAVVYLWQAKRHIGAGLVNAPGAFCWNELGTRDPDVAQRFWAGLLGWEFERVDAGPLDIWTIRNAGSMNGNLRRMGDETPPDVPSHWLVYFAVDSIDAATPKAGNVLVPKTRAGGENSFAVFSDPAGATFGLFEGRLDD
jgi:predicted enzyme related to lactoylglutathione lyase